MPNLGLVVTDLDRTFTDTRLRLVPQALRTLAEVRDHGVQTVLATGRTLSELERKNGLLELFDALVLEGGGLIGTRDALQPTRPNTKPFDDLALWLNEKGVLYHRGAASLSISRNDLRILKRYPGLHAFLALPNRNRVDLTLAGVDKGTALRSLRRRHALRKGRILAFGDGENDVRLFQAADWTVAVSNAVPALKAMADDVTRYNGGRGVADYLRRNVLG